MAPSIGSILIFITFTLLVENAKEILLLDTMAQDQIRQMVNFILQEAHEKANEIRVKVRRSNIQDKSLSVPSQSRSDEEDLLRLCRRRTIRRLYMTSLLIFVQACAYF